MRLRKEGHMDEQEKEVKYIPVYQKRLAKYLLLAKGKDRTMAEFAELCNANPTTFSRQNSPS